MTPAELDIYAKAWADTQKQQAYLQALTIRAMIGTLLSGKRAPAFERLFSETKQPIKKSGPMTDQAMYEMVKALNATFGGSDLTTKKGGDTDGGSA